MEASKFLMRVRNELHYSQKGRTGDILTLRLQGIVANNLKYPGKNMVRRSENFMLDYYPPHQGNVSSQHFANAALSARSCR